jgi:predicted NAD-dependent protein-ADP-ribosyltransferase YbiA (DUF1768 family)
MMRIIQAERKFLLVAETEAERDGLDRIAREASGSKLQVEVIDREGLTLRPAGQARKLVCADTSIPINITYDAVPMPLRLIANLAEAPFELDGRRYASTEGFWQGLKFPGEADRLRVAALSGHAAKSVAPPVQLGDKLLYEGKEVCVGTVDHWALMERACRAKFTQHEGARAALLSTADTPIVHKVEPDSRTIPGIVMADIWMRIRADLAAA